jgi:acyl-CoA thioester hydrolase
VERFSRSFIVRWADCDANGHLRNTCYSEYTIEVRMALLAAHGFGLPEFRKAGIGPVLLREEIDYWRECHMGEELRVDVTALGLSPDGTRFKLAHDLYKPDGKKAARVIVYGGWLDLTGRRLAAPPEALKAIFENVERVEPFETLPLAKAVPPAKDAPRAK